MTEKQNKRATMPTKAQIRNAWKYAAFDVPNDLKTCWGCGFGGGFIDRAHIKAVHAGGSNDPANIVLLCRACHIAQESICGTLEGRQNFRAAIIDGAPFMKARMAYMSVQIELMGSAVAEPMEQS